jgi:hypothetical protein
MLSLKSLPINPDAACIPNPKISYPTMVDPCHEIIKIFPVWPIRDVYPGSRILIFIHPGSRIPDPKTATKERGEKKFDVIIHFYLATNFTKLYIILVLKC